MSTITPAPPPIQPGPLPVEPPPRTPWPRRLKAWQWALMGVAIILAISLITTVTTLTLLKPTPTPQPTAAATATTAPQPTNTPAATAAPVIPTLRYRIGTLAGSQSVQAIPGVALAVNSGTNDQWTQTTCTGLTCASGGTADLGGPAGHAVYQVFTCQLSGGQSSGQCGFTFSATGAASAPEERAQVEVYSLSGAQGSTQTLSYEITTSSQSNRTVSVALASSTGTPYEWAPANDFQGLTCALVGTAHAPVPPGVAGYTVYQVFTCQLAAGQSVGQGSFTFSRMDSSTPEGAAVVKVQLGS
ncbi:MAG TPA: hypothetical protein VF818_12730 [Ktedonobacterales bacterium]